MAIAHIGQTVDIGHGRGRATPRAAASIRRVDAALGRPWDVNSAWRNPVVQQGLRDAYEHYLRYGRPWAPIALEPEDSVHCAGEAVDSDDQSSRIVALLAEHGWRRTVYRSVNGKWTLVEPWHYEYFIGRDQHLGKPASGGNSNPIPVPVPADLMEAIRMSQIRYVHRNEEGYNLEWMIVGMEIPGGFEVTADKTRAEGWGAVYGTDKGGSWKGLTRAQYVGLQASARELHEKWLAMQKQIHG